MYTMDKSLPDNTLKICSFNSKGHDQDRIEYMKNLFTICGIMLFQEHWYFEQDIKLLDKLMSKFMEYFVCATMNFVQVDPSVVVLLYLGIVSNVTSSLFILITSVVVVC